MTLAQAQKEFADAIQMKTKHGKYAMTKSIMNSFASNIFGNDKPSKVLYSEIGKYSSRIIVSHMAFLEEKRQLSMTPGT